MPWATAPCRSTRRQPRRLRAKGFTDDVLETIENALGSAFDIKFVFNKFTLGEEFCATPWV